MAYISAAEVKVIRDNIKAAFPVKDGWKFSVRGDNHTAVRVALMAYPKGYEFPGHASVNHYHIDRMESVGDKEKEVLKKVSAIVHEKHWDKSDIMIDYFNCAFYVTIEIGKWDKDAVMVEPKAKKAPKKATPKAAPVAKSARDIRRENDFLKVAEFIGIVF